MEEYVFPRPAVADLLEKEFIEARIHIDHPTKGVEHQALALKLVGSLANPQYAIVDPATKKIVKTHRLSMPISLDGWETKFIKFLKTSL